MYEVAEPAYGGDIEFVKANASGQAYLSPGARHTVMFEAAAGLGSGDLPYQEQYGIGGADYMLGFPLLGYQRREFTGSNFMGSRQPTLESRRVNQAREGAVRERRGRAAMSVAGSDLDA
jgi:hypothetical protein